VSGTDRQLTSPETDKSWLFPVLEDELGVLDEKHRQFVALCELCTPQDHMDASRDATAIHARSQ